MKQRKCGDSCAISRASLSCLDLGNAGVARSRVEIIEVLSARVLRIYGDRYNQLVGISHFLFVTHGSTFDVYTDKAQYKATKRTNLDKKTTQ
jgi:hypothetical protein